MSAIEIAALQIIDAAPLDMMRGYAVKRELVYRGFWFVFWGRGGAALRRLADAGYLVRTMHDFNREERAGLQEARYQLTAQGKAATTSAPRD